VNRPDLGKGVVSGACWDLGVYLSEIGKVGAETLVDDGSGNGTTVRACVKASNALVDDGTGSRTTVRACVKAGNTKKRASAILGAAAPAKWWREHTAATKYLEI
jgi:hypothetical protein